MGQIDGNKCGHDRDRLRFCNEQDITRAGRKRKRRGKGGRPPILGRIAAALERAALSGQTLTTWQNLNDSGRKRRSEARERLAVVQWLIFEEMRLESRRCGYVDADGDFIAPDLELIARQLSDSSRDWQGGPRFSYHRILRTLRELELCGYIKRGEQYRYQTPQGDWRSSTRVITFTKRFFLELGGSGLWQAVYDAGQARVREIALQIAATGGAIRAGVAALFEYKRIFSPWQAKTKPKPWAPFSEPSAPPSTI